MNKGLKVKQACFLQGEGGIGDGLARCIVLTPTPDFSLNSYAVGT